MPPRTIRVPLPSNVALDRDFRIDIVEPRSGTIGLNIAHAIQIEGFRAFCPPGRDETERDVLRSPELWSTFMRWQLTGPMAQYIQGIHTKRRDLVPSSGIPPHALHASIPGGPMYPELSESVTVPAPYKTLHEVLADILACQAVWYARVLRRRPEVAERASERPGPDGQIWQAWRWACRHPEVDFLDVLYIVSIRRMRVANTWAYFPEVEIRSS